MNIGQTFKSYDKYIGFNGVCVVSTVRPDEIIVTYLETKNQKVIPKSKIKGLLESGAFIEVTQ